MGALSLLLADKMENKELEEEEEEGGLTTGLGVGLRTNGGGAGMVLDPANVVYDRFGACGVTISTAPLCLVFDFLLFIV